MRTKQIFKTHLLSLTAFFSMALAFTSCANEDIAQHDNGNGAINDNDKDKNLTTFIAGDPKTRTSMDYNDGTFYWEEGDRIYAQDDDGTWRMSSNAVDAAHAHSASFKFKMPGKYTIGNIYRVYYPGKNGYFNHISIPNSQRQVAPNSTDHLGTSGDCGIADAAWSSSSNGFAFEIEHQNTILVFQPYTSNPLLRKCVIKQINIISDNNISGTYDFNPTTGELTGTGDNKEIHLFTGTSGFPLTDSYANINTNGAYMTISPGVHTLRVRYWLEDPNTGVSGCVTKDLPAFDYKKNTYYDMMANLTIRDYPATNYYMWDAQKNYWYKHEWNAHNVSDRWQPTENGGSNPNYPTNTDADRWCNENYPGDGIRYDAQTSLFQSLPNANEMAWYAMKGEPREENTELWSTMGRLEVGEIWLKKKSKIAGFSSEHAPDGVTDLRTTYKNFENNNVKRGLPPVGEMDDYFPLPKLTEYLYGTLFGKPGNSGESAYWSSSAAPLTTSGEKLAYVLIPDYVSVRLSYVPRYWGIIARPFE